MKKRGERGKRQSQNIMLSVRMRPRLSEFEDEEAWGVEGKSKSLFSLQKPTVMQPSESGMLIKRRYADAYYDYKFSFDNVFGPEDSTESVYKGCCRALIKSIFGGYNCTIFMYGQTTSGKTYTMMGSPQNPGILPYSLHDIYSEVSRLKEEGHVFDIEVSYLQIYNEQINDLLNPGSMNLKIHEDSDKSIVVQGLKHCKSDNFSKAVFLMRFGEEQRCYKEKHIHDHSSRSHTIFQLRLSFQHLRDGLQVRTTSVLNMVDLAGSERIQDEQPRADNYDETGYINKSLFILSNVINKLADGKRHGHIPYRDSKLTRFLSNSLGGNSKTAIICTVSPAAMNFYQTLSTLRFASRAKKISNTPLVNEEKTIPLELNDLKEELLCKSQEIEELKAEIVRLNLSLSGKESRTLATVQDPTSTPTQENSYIRQVFGVFEERLEKENYQRAALSKWRSKAECLMNEYEENVLILQEKYRTALTNLTQRELNCCAKESPTKALSSLEARIIDGTIFNEIKVSATLSPEYSLEGDHRSRRRELREAFEEAKGRLVKEYEELKGRGLPRELSGKAGLLFQSKLKVLNTAYKEALQSLVGE